MRENPSIRKSLLELVFSLFSRRERIRHARLWRENSPSPAEEAVASFKVRSPKSAIFGGGSLTFFGCSVTLSLALLRSFGKCARRILEVTLGKSVVLPRFNQLHLQLLLLHFLLLILLLLLLLGEEEGVWGRGRGWNILFHAANIPPYLLQLLRLLLLLLLLPSRTGII